MCEKKCKCYKKLTDKNIQAISIDINTKEKEYFCKDCFIKLKQSWKDHKDLLPTFIDIYTQKEWGL